MTNLDTIFEKTFRFTEGEARRFYFRVWRQDQKPCSAFRGEVVKITRIGWDHITHAERRSKLDLLGRFFVLERAKILLETATYFQNYRKDGEVEYWELSGVVDEVRVVAIVRSIKKGSKHLFSVIRRGTVSTPQKK